MLKIYLAEKKISTYSLAKRSRVPYSTLNDIVNGKVDITNVKSGILRALSAALYISMDELYDLCSERIEIYDAQNDIYGYVSKKNKIYYLKFQYDAIEYEQELCAIKRESSLFIRDIALWKMEQLISDIKMEEAYAVCIKTQR